MFLPTFYDIITQMEEECFYEKINGAEFNFPVTDSFGM